MLQVALNGPHGPKAHPALPTTPAQVARAGLASEAAGAAEVHVHVYGAGGVESLAPRDVAAVVDALRDVLPDTPIGVSTGAWIVPEPTRRAATVAAWSARPDYASVNFHEAGADLVARTLLDHGMAIEAGLRDEAAVRAFLAADLADGCYRVLLEPSDQGPIDALQTAARMEALLDRAGSVVPRLLHGEGATAWPLLRRAAQVGLGARIGLEDTFELPDGRPAPDNAALVRAARALMGGPSR